MPTVFTNGCFDILHPGHYQLLLYCRHLAEGDAVYVAIDTDEKIKREKGSHRPYYDEEERVNLMMTLTSDGKLDSCGYGKYLIDWVDTFNTDEELHALIKRLQPDYIVKGEDWKHKHVVGSDIATVHFAPTYYKDFFSTSHIEKRILDKWVIRA